MVAVSVVGFFCSHGNSISCKAHHSHTLSVIFTASTNFMMHISFHDTLMFDVVSLVIFYARAVDNSLLHSVRTIKSLQLSCIVLGHDESHAGGEVSFPHIVQNRIRQKGICKQSGRKQFWFNKKKKWTKIMEIYRNEEEWNICIKISMAEGLP